MYIFLQGFALNYSRTEALRTRKVIRNAVIDVIERGLHHETDWNVKVVLETAEQARTRRRPAAKRHRQVRVKVRSAQIEENK